MDFKYFPKSKFLSEDGLTYLQPLQALVIAKLIEQDIPRSLADVNRFGGIDKYRRSTYEGY